jgi:hypothetical protein
MATVVRIVHFFKAVRTGCDVRRYLSEPFGSSALSYAERFVALGLQRIDADFIDSRRRRSLDAYLFRELMDVFFFTLDFDLDAIGCVTDKTVESQTACQAINIGSETDTLDNASNPYSFSAWHLSLFLNV